jgi:hypothetical protein
MTISLLVQMQQQKSAWRVRDQTEEAWNQQLDRTFTLLAKSYQELLVKAADDGDGEAVGVDQEISLRVSSITRGCQSLLQTIAQLKQVAIVNTLPLGSRYNNTDDMTETDSEEETLMQT